MQRVHERGAALRNSVSEAEKVIMERPLLFLDVDGVISLFGLTEAPTETLVVNEQLHFIPPAMASRVRRLAEGFDLVWATGWEKRANEHLLPVLGLSGPLPYLTFGGLAVFGSADWKLDAIAATAEGRAAAWVDDNHDQSSDAWAYSRTVPTMLVTTESHTGLTDDLVEALMSWAAEFAPAGAISSYQAV